MAKRVPQPFNLDIESRISLNLNAKFEFDLESPRSDSPAQSETAISPLPHDGSSVQKVNKKRLQPTKSDLDEDKYDYAVKLIKRLKL